MNPDASQNTGPVYPSENQQYDTMNNKVMLSAVLSLSIVILVVLILHIYARCAMRRAHRQAGVSLRHLPLQVVPHLAGQPKAGLEPNVIASLPLFVVSEQDQGQLNEDGQGSGSSECAVCLSGLEAGEEARMLPNCKHRFHVECIDTWLSGQTNCPICRAEVAPWSVDGETQRIAKEGASGSSRLSSFRRIMSRDWSSSSTRIQPLGLDVVQDLERV